MDMSSLYQRLGLRPQELEGQLNASNPEEFSAQFKKLMSSSAAKRASKVIYIVVHKRPNPEAKGSEQYS